MKPSPTQLKGKEAIEIYSGYCWKTIVELMETRKFPASMVNGKHWESDKNLIDFWKRAEILGLEQGGDDV